MGFFEIQIFQDELLQLTSSHKALQWLGTTQSEQDKNPAWASTGWGGRWHGKMREIKQLGVFQKKVTTFSLS